MSEIKFETGLVEYDLGGKAKVTFNPSDVSFARRLYGVFEELDRKQVEYQTAIDRSGDAAALFDVLERLDRDMRAQLDGVLGVGVCEAVFGTMNLSALAGGFPVWANLLLAIMDEMDASIEREASLTNPRIEKYTRKYRARKQGKKSAARKK